MLNIVITAGGTSERIDNVRKITNSSSGKLGKTIAETFLTKNKDNIEKIYYICAKNALKPEKNEKIEFLTIESANDVYQILQEVLTTTRIDIVIHSMAISDYTVDYVTTSNDLAKTLQNKSILEIENTLATDDLAIDNSDKISSNKSDLFIKLTPTKKIISYIKKWSPSSKLIGFKLLSNVPENELISVASKLLIKNDCDYVVANDITNIDLYKHHALIIDRNKNITKAQTKQEIADILSNLLF